MSSVFIISERVFLGCSGRPRFTQVYQHRESCISADMRIRVYIVRLRKGTGQGWNGGGEGGRRGLGYTLWLIEAWIPAGGVGCAPATRSLSLICIDSLVRKASFLTPYPLLPHACNTYFSLEYSLPKCPEYVWVCVEPTPIYTRIVDPYFCIRTLYSEWEPSEHCLRKIPHAYSSVGNLCEYLGRDWTLGKSRLERLK